MRHWLAAIIWVAMSLCQLNARADVAVPFRTDSTNTELPWYRLRSGEFPPKHSEHQISGELVEADYIHRRGQFRAEDTGELVNFSLLPYSVLYYLNTEADLRDIPLGTHLRFLMYLDSSGAFTQAVVIRDDVTSIGGAPNPSTEAQRKNHIAFLKKRGLAARIDQVDGKKLIVTILGDPDSLQKLLKDEHIDPEQWVQQHRQVRAVVANEELRTYNPPVDGQGSQLLQIQSEPTDRYGCSGMQWVIQPNLLLEGFRKGHIIRLFLGWQVNDMPFGETLYTERPGAKMEEESPNQYSYRTDFGNEQLPWYQLTPGQFPPFQSQHVVIGELLKIDPVHRSGQFRTDRTGELVSFTMPPYGSVRYLNAEAEAEDLSIGTRYSFYLYQDESGAFTQAVVIEDDFTRLAGETTTCRLDAANLDRGFIIVSDQLAQMKDDKDHLVRPPDLSHAMFGIDGATRVWKDGERASLSDLTPGDDLLINLSGSTLTRRSRCTDIWIGLDTHKLASENQRAKHKAFIRENGLPAWIKKVEGSAITVTLFSDNRKDFRDVLNGDPDGQKVTFRHVDSDLHPVGDRVEVLKYRTHIPERETAGTYGSAGVWWILDAEKMPPDFHELELVRIMKSDWPAKGVKK